MSFFSKMEMQVTLSAVGIAGRAHTIVIPWYSEERWNRVFEVAHQHADGSLPSAAECDSPAQWELACALRHAEERLRLLCTGEWTGS